MTEDHIEVLLDHPNRVWDIAYNEDDALGSHDDEDDDNEDSDDDGGDDDDSDDGGSDDEDEDSDGNEPLATLFDEPLLEDLWLDKSWAILQFLLLKAAGRSPTDLGNSSSELLWGETVGDEPADYYGPMLRSIEDTKEFAAFLQPLTSDQLLSHFDWQEMRKSRVYLVSKDEEEEGLREYAGENFRALRDYVLKAAASGCGLLLWVS